MTYTFAGEICDAGPTTGWCKDADPGTKPLDAVRELWYELSESRWAVWLGDRCGEP